MSYTYYTEGWLSDEYSLNVANCNAMIPALMMGLDFGDLHVPSGHIPMILERLESLDLTPYITPDITVGNFTACGRTLEQVTRYRNKLIQMLEKALEAGTTVSWG